MKITFRTKLFLFCVAIILATSIPISITINNYMYDLLKSELVSDSKKKMEEIDKNISYLMDQMKKNAEILANSNDIKKTNNSITALFNIPNIETNKKYSEQIPGIESTIYNNFELYAKTHEETEYVCFGTKWGGYIQWPDELSNSNYDPRQRPWYSLAMEYPNEVVISDPHKVEIDDSKNITISACTTVKNTSGDTVGVIAVDTSLNKLSEIINNIKIGDNGYAFIYSDDGTILAHPNANLNFQNIKEMQNKSSRANDQDQFLIQNTNKLIDAENENFETVVNGSGAFINVYTSPYTGWKIATVIPKSELTSKVIVVEKLIFTITIGVLMLGITLIYFVVRSITKPIRELTPLMELAGEGDLSVRADIKTNDEFGNLGNSFNLMIRQLSSSYEELSEVYEELVATEEELRTQYDELKDKEEALENSEERYKLALECANDSIWEWDLGTKKFFISDKLADITGYNLEVVNNIKDILQEIVHPEDLTKVKEDLQMHINNVIPAIYSEYRVKTSNDSYKWIVCRGKAIKDSDGKIIKVAGSITDISKRKIAEEKIKFMAYYDMLTKLPNKTLFIDKLNEELEVKGNNDVKGAVFFIDLDDFKNINNLMGHKYGDELLTHLASQFEILIDKKDTIYRWGGDEFIILNTSIEESEVQAYSNKLLDIFNRSFKLYSKQMSITASIGVALYPKDGTDSDTIMKNADSAMYEAKRLGKNRVALYKPEIYLKLERKTTIERIVKEAIENNEFSINYQPQYDALNNVIFGFEALIRLNSKELGFISPVEFIPIAEECGYITEISLWVFREACIQSAEWFTQGYKFKSMSVNISSVDLQQPDFLKKITQIINETGIEPKVIEVEITETVLMQRFDSSINALNQLMEMGIRIALDDFGTGYSSLNYLRKIPISTLKIDKSFIDNIVSSKKEESIINNIIQMAHTLDLKVVAEGVETKDQLSILKDKNCDYIQGYYFSKPLPENEIRKLLAFNL